MLKGNLNLRAPFTVRASEDEIKSLNEIGNELNPNFDDSTTAREFVFWLLNRVNNLVKQSAPSATADKEAIQLLENEIGRLKTLLDFTQKEFEELKETAILSHERAETAEVKLLEAQQFGLKLSEDQIVLTLNPVILAILEEEAKAAQKQTGKDFAIGDIIKNLIWDTVRRVSNYPLHKLWSNSEISKLVKSLKEKISV